MRNAQVRRSTWLRRTRRLTGWISALAVAATLLIAVAVGTASSRASAAPLVRAPAATHRDLRLAERRRRIRQHSLARRRSLRRVARSSQRKTTVVVVRPRTHRVVPTPPPAPAPAPPAAPVVVVSGGS